MTHTVLHNVNKFRGRQKQKGTRQYIACSSPIQNGRLLSSDVTANRAIYIIVKYYRLLISSIKATCFGTKFKTSVNIHVDVFKFVISRIFVQNTRSTEAHIFYISHTYLLVYYTGHFIISVITNIYDKKTKGPTLMELFTATEKLKKFFFTTRDFRCVHHG
jgi:hypothetical protein